MTSPFSLRSTPGSEPSWSFGSDPRFPVLHDLSCTDTTGWPESRELERSALDALVHPDATRYVPDSAGSRSAREALAAIQEPRDSSRWILTASSSEAYSLLFQLLCDPGSRVATPRPGYPLVDELGRFQNVSVAPIPMRWTDCRWNLDLGWTQKRLQEGIRALVLIQPANPTGWTLSPVERRAVLDLCIKHGIPLISDEVFEAWANPGFESLATQNEVLCFTLGGLSKLVGLPHLKLGWIRVSGPQELVQEAVRRLETLNDALLSASTPVQCALPALLSKRELFQERIASRLERNRHAWKDFQQGLPEGFQALEATSGWFAILQWTLPVHEEAVCTRLLERGVKVLPGYLFDLPEAGLVVSLVSEPSSFLHGLCLMSSLLISLDL